VARLDGMTLITFHSMPQGLVNPAHDEYLQWIDGLSETDDPYLRVGRVHNTAVGVQLENEAHHILAFYATLRAADFVPYLPVLPAMPPTPATPVLVHYHHATTALRRVRSQIGNPGATCPTIHALPAHTPICNLEQTYGQGQIVQEHISRW
jgi:hypothetical protein